MLAPVNRTFEHLEIGTGEWGIMLSESEPGLEKQLQFFLSLPQLTGVHESNDFPIFCVTFSHLSSREWIISFSLECILKLPHPPARCCWLSLLLLIFQFPFTGQARLGMENVSRLAWCGCNLMSRQLSCLPDPHGLHATRWSTAF